MALYSKKANFIFIHVYKCGGTSFRDMSKYLFPDTQEIGLYHSSALEIKNIFMNEGNISLFDKAFKFSFVRNPFDLILSLWEYIKTDSTHPQYNDIQMMSFSSFVDFYIDCIKNNKQNSNGGYGTLCDFVLDENMNPILDYTGRMESYELNIKEILKKLNVSTNTTIMHSNKGIDKHYLNYFDKKLIASVSEFFKKDLEIFKYQY